jgi:hypothetical protein
VLRDAGSVPVRYMLLIRPLRTTHACNPYHARQQQCTVPEQLAAAHSSWHDGACGHAEARHHDGGCGWVTHSAPQAVAHTVHVIAAQGALRLARVVCLQYAYASQRAPRRGQHPSQVVAVEVPAVARVRRIEHLASGWMVLRPYACARTHARSSSSASCQAWRLVKD